MIDPWTAWYGVACLATLALAVHGEDHSAIFMAALCMAVWAISNIGWSRDAIYLFPAIDLLVALIAVDLWRMETRRWQAAFLCLATAQVGFHVINELTQSAYFVVYAYALNITFAAQLAVVGSTGGSGIVDSLRHRFRRFHLFCHWPAQGRR
jgi:hypothetical protein